MLTLIGSIKSDYGHLSEMKSFRLRTELVLTIIVFIGSSFGDSFRLI